MESKPRGTGAVAAGRVLQEFEPKMEWDRELGVDTLRVFLPGFKKEQIKVQVSSSRVLRISGERQLSDNRWSCFLEKIPLSSNHNQKEISASYDKGILYVKHPKLIVQDDAELQENEQPPVESSTLDGKPPQEKALQPTKMDKDKAAKGLVSGAQKLNMESYSKDFSGLVVDMTKPRKLLNLVLFILSVVVLGIQEYIDGILAQSMRGIGLMHGFVPQKGQDSGFWGTKSINYDSSSVHYYSHHLMLDMSESLASNSKAYLRTSPLP
ncbi:hypothetical protein D5086_018799 [Populus alba]|uniref:Uncharacterized protein n=1 Tax=Populus alba TaxID=43335 RepID=A0ACC4BQU1_POPAL